MLCARDFGVSFSPCDPEWQVQGCHTAWALRWKISSALFSLGSFAVPRVSNEAKRDFYSSLLISSVVIVTILSLLILIVFWYFQREEGRRVLSFYFQCGSCPYRPVDVWVANPCVTLRWVCYAREGSKWMRKPLREAGSFRALHGTLFGWQTPAEPTGRACLISNRFSSVYNV